MDMGDLKSKDIGTLTLKGLIPSIKSELANTGDIPDTVQNQNLGHNAKKEALGPNTKR